MAFGKVNTTSVNLRREPDPNAEVIVTLAKGASVETVGDEEDGWLLVIAAVGDVQHIGNVQSRFIDMDPSDSGPSLSVQDGEILHGDGSFHFTAIVNGPDILVRGVVSSWFGGPNDPSDNGKTASGVSTRDNPETMGCALPMDGFHHPSTNGSPLPRLPWKTQVRVRHLRNDLEVTVPLIDLGPSKFVKSHAALDLTPAAFRALGADTREGLIRVDYAIIDGARHLPSFTRDGVSLPGSELPNKPDVPLSPLDPAHGPDDDITKPPIKKFIRSPNFQARSDRKIDMIVLHYTEGSSASGAINRFLNPSEKVSAHYIIERNGDIYQMVADANVAWHAKSVNSRSIGIEHVAVRNQQMSEDQKKSSVALVQWLVKTYGVDPSRIKGHRFAAGEPTNCPDHLFGEATEEAVTKWVNENIRI